MNKTVDTALDLVSYRNDGARLFYLMEIATNAAKRTGVLSSIAITARLDLREWINGLNYLTNQQKRALFIWAAADYSRKEEKGDDRRISRRASPDPLQP